MDPYLHVIPLIAAKQKITPRTQESLKLHENAYKVALDGRVPEEASRAVVQAMDRVYCSAGFDLKPRSSEEHKCLMHYVKLRRLKLLANYSDYLGQELQKIRADLKAAVVDAAFDMGDLRKQVYIDCDVLGIDANHMLWLIIQWAERKRTLHNQIRQYISDCHWPRLAKQLRRDLKELLNVVPPDTATMYENVLLSIQTEYFDVKSRDDPEYWFVNEKAKKLTKERLVREKKQAQKSFS